jgi:phosphate transport system protein
VIPVDESVSIGRPAPDGRAGRDSPRRRATLANDTGRRSTLRTSAAALRGHSGAGYLCPVPPAARPGVDIAEIDRRVIQLFALVGELVAGATLALLSGDRQAAKGLVARDAEVDKGYRTVESLAWEQLEDGVAGPQLRYLVSVLHMLPEIERSGDLAEHIAARAVRGIGLEMSARARGLVEQMGEVACTMWRMAADAYGDHSADAAERIDRLDDAMDDLTVTLTAEILGGDMVLPVAVDVAMIGRFYERLGDHAVNLARRVSTWISGGLVPPAGEATDGA